MTTEQVPLLKKLHGPPHLRLKELLALHGPPAQAFRINPEKRTLITGAGGTRLTFAPYSITNASGQPVAGMAEIILKEVFTQGDMILADRPTASEDRLMESGGQLMIYASQKQQLLALSQPLEVDLPVRRHLRNPVAMRLFVGGVSTFLAYSYGSNFDWRMASEKPVRIHKIEGRKYYNFQLWEFNWADCDFFVAQRSARCMVTARPISTLEKFDNLLAYLVFKDVHAVARMYPGINGCTAVNIPEKLSATAHLVGLSNGQLYYGNGFIQRARDKLVSVKMQPVQERELIGLLREL